jgi:glutaredoxin
MKTKAISYHAGCAVCVAAEQNVANALDPAKYDLEIVHLGNDKTRLKEAESAGVKSVPALVMDAQHSISIMALASRHCNSRRITLVAPRVFASWQTPFFGLLNFSIDLQEACCRKAAARVAGVAS